MWVCRSVGARQRKRDAAKLCRLAYALVRLTAPLLAFTAEEVWKELRQPGSVHTAFFPDPEELTAGLSDKHRKRLQNWDRLMEVREDVLKSLETARQSKLIGAPLEARVSLSANENLYPLLEQYAGDLPALFVVSQVSVTNHDDALKVAIDRAAGVKCQRCWKYTTDVGSNADFPTICAGCSAAVTENLNG